jgi:hypothetical protein
MALPLVRFALRQNLSAASLPMASFPAAADIELQQIKSPPVILC